ncbi:hypothetical protein HCZ30_01640 [Marivivens donghaensis]|uniref:Uncharacterized protein n=1 Tax=Marivivens donghaensis TaxID=1699413 RepID=A0ABX0VU94_9RHOB|nr:hypothetical protein [Marivivens donghaensis]NIY71133.1 hypothetical protein [Marivivens donghaensis]
MRKRFTAQIALDQHQTYVDANKALFDSLESVLDELADKPEMVEFFRLFSKYATLANAKKIAAHPDCPKIVGDEIQQRIEESKSGRK